MKNKVDLGRLPVDCDDEFFNISFGITMDYTAQVGVLMTTIVVNNKDMLFYFHIFCDNITDCDLKKFERFANMYKNIAITIYYINNEALAQMRTSYLS